MINLKSSRVGSEYLVCLCDSNLIGRTLEEGEVQLRVPASFYGDKVVSEKIAIDELKNATIINALGIEAIELVKKLFKLDKVIMINGVPHAQIFSIK